MTHQGKAPQNGLSMPTSAMGVCFRPVVLLMHNELALLSKAVHLDRPLVQTSYLASASGADEVLLGTLRADLC